MSFLNILNFGLKNLSGRDKKGHLIVYHRGSGVKNKYRFIDFTRELNFKFKYKVIKIMYDPIRTANIALILYPIGVFSYIIAPYKRKINMVVDTIKPWFINKLGMLNLLHKIRKSVMVSQISFPSIAHRYKIIFVRSAGTKGICLGPYRLNFTIVRLPSREIRIFPRGTVVAIGRVSNRLHRFRSIGKAGVNRWLNKRPIVRGVAMNPVDHPHGGGEGKSSGGRHPVSPWGRLTKGGVKTRRRFFGFKFILGRNYM